MWSGCLLSGGIPEDRLDSHFKEPPSRSPDNFGTEGSLSNDQCNGPIFRTQPLYHIPQLYLERYDAYAIPVYDDSQVAKDRKTLAC